VSLTLFGVVALTFMMAMYAMEKRARVHRGLRAGLHPLQCLRLRVGLVALRRVEALWTLIALRRYRQGR
jgi:hypothetical protein